MNGCQVEGSNKRANYGFTDDRSRLTKIC